MSTRVNSAAPLCALALLFSAAAGADTFETTTRETPVPAARDGSLTVRACSTCPQKLVRLDNESTFHVGAEAVKFVDFVRYVASSGERFLNVTYDPQTGLVKRLRVSGQLSAQPTRGTR